jgi:hypothetical protein
MLEREPKHLATSVPKTRAKFRSKTPFIEELDGKMKSVLS